jgi:hydrogenase large subunit
MASVIALESAFGVLPPDNARILRNLVLGAEYIMSHTLHFYHLTLLDYINTEGIIGVSPWISGYVTADMVTGATAKTLFNHYIQALAIRRKAHQMAAIFGAKLPCPPTFVLGGFTEVVTTDKVSDFRGLLTELRQFIYNVYIPDVYTIAGAFRNYFNIGVGCGNLLAYGVFDLDITGANLLPRGRYTNGVYGDVDPTLITEYVRYSWYTAESGTLNPRGV